MPANTIGEGAIKISFIQTKPGYEITVKQELEDGCAATDEINDYVFLKGLGVFDIIAIYSTKDFNSSLRKSGPIKHILKSNSLLFYPYATNSIDEIFYSLKKGFFTSFCLLKICQGLKMKFPTIEDLLRNYMKSENEIFLGSLGWNELITLYSSDDFDQVCGHIAKNTGITYFSDSPKESYPAILKTLTTVGINYNSLPSSELMNQGLQAITRFCQSKTELDRTIQSHQPAIEISAKSIYLGEIRRFFESRGFSYNSLIGKYDAIIRLKDEKMKWSEYLAAILYFRHEFKDKVVSTNTRIQFDDPIKTPNYVKDLSPSVTPYGFDYQKLEDVFGKDMASNLSNTFFTLNSLFQNSLTGFTYFDMRKYPEYVVNTSQIISDTTTNNEEFALVSDYLIGRGAEVRSYGTNETIDEVTGRFSEFRGGCQVSILAMELIPTVIMNHLNDHLASSQDKTWKGFITITGEPKFSHLNHIINVRPEALWNPQYWWALYHEIAHIILSEIPPLLSEEDNVFVKTYLAPRSEAAKDELEEIAAEIIGYELGFFGNFNLYKELFWHLLVELNKYEYLEYEQYALRSFFVEFYALNFMSNQPTSISSEDQLLDLDILFEQFTRHMTSIEVLLDNKTIFGNEKKFIAARNVKKIKDLYPFCKGLCENIQDIDLHPDNQLLKSKNTLEVEESLLNGKIWWQSIDSPQAILYHLFNNRNLEFKTQIATILSLWNQQFTKLAKYEHYE